MSLTTFPGIRAKILLDIVNDVTALRVSDDGDDLMFQAQTGLEFEIAHIVAKVVNILLHERYVVYERIYP